MDNAAFYKDGKFNSDKAKQAYYDLMRKFNVPVYSELARPDGPFWAVDFGKGDFTAFGMGGVFWCNEKEEGYFGHEIYLLPGVGEREGACALIPAHQPGIHVDGRNIGSARGGHKDFAASGSIPADIHLIDAFRTVVFHLQAEQAAGSVKTADIESLEFRSRVEGNGASAEAVDGRLARILRGSSG